MVENLVGWFCNIFINDLSNSSKFRVCPFPPPCNCIWGDFFLIFVGGSEGRGIAVTCEFTFWEGTILGLDEEMGNKDPIPNPAPRERIPVNANKAIY